MCSVDLAHPHLRKPLQSKGVHVFVGAHVRGWQCGYRNNRANLVRRCRVEALHVNSPCIGALPAGGASRRLPAEPSLPATALDVQPLDLVLQQGYRIVWTLQVRHEISRRAAHITLMLGY